MKAQAVNLPVSLCASAYSRERHRAVPRAAGGGRQRHTAGVRRWRWRASLPLYLLQRPAPVHPEHALSTPALSPAVLNPKQPE